MARTKSRNIPAAQRAPFDDSYSVATQQKMGLNLTKKNGWTDRWSSADGSYEIPGPGVDSNNIPNLFGESIKPMMQPFTFTIGANGSIATTRFFIADQTYYIQGISYVHKTLVTGTLAAVRVTHDVGNVAAGSGTSITTADFDPTATNATVQTKTLNGEVNYIGDPVLTLSRGDSLSFKLGAGTLTAYAGVTLTVWMTPGAASAVAQYFVAKNADLSTQTFFTALRDMTVTGVYAMYDTPFAAAVTIDITKDATTAAAGAGTSVLLATMAGDGTAATLLTPALAASAATLTMKAGDSLAVKYSATTTGTGVCILVTFAPLYRYKQVTIQIGPNAQQAVTQYFFVADRDYIVDDAAFKGGTAAGGAGDVAVTIDRTTAAPGAGDIVQTDNTNAGFDVNATANTVQFVTPAALRLRRLSAGSRLGLKWTGAAQSTANTCITVGLVPA